MGKGIVGLLQKMMMALSQFNARGEELQITMPPGYTPTSLEIELTWPQVFPLTIMDMQGLMTIASGLASANMISRATALKWLMAKGVDLGVEDIEAETAVINAQQEFNTFGF